MAHALWGGETEQNFELETLDASVVASRFVKQVEDYVLYEKEVFEPAVGGCTSAITCPPLAGMVKANFDSHTNQAREVGLGVILRDHNRSILAMGVKRLAVKWHANVAEAAVARYDVDLALKLGYVSLVGEWDALMVVKVVKQGTCESSPIFHFLNDVRRMAREFDVFSMYHVKRAGNIVVRLLARWESNCNAERVWLDSFPQSILTLVELDLI